MCSCASSPPQKTNTPSANKKGYNYLHQWDYQAVASGMLAAAPRARALRAASEAEAAAAVAEARAARDCFFFIEVVVSPNDAAAGQLRGRGFCLSRGRLLRWPLTCITNVFEGARSRAWERTHAASGFITTPHPRPTPSRPQPPCYTHCAPPPQSPA